MSKVKIRAAVSFDLLTLLSLGEEYVKEAERWSDLKFDPKRAVLMAEFAIDDPYQQIFVAHKDGEIVGFYWVGVTQPMWSSDPIGYDVFIYVKPGHRNLFTALRLVREFEKWMKALGVKIAHVSSSSGLRKNSNAHSLYRREGYRDVGVTLIKKFKE